MTAGDLQDFVLAIGEEGGLLDPRWVLLNFGGPVKSNLSASVSDDQLTACFKMLMARNYSGEWLGRLGEYFALVRVREADDQ